MTKAQAYLNVFRRVPIEDTKVLQRLDRGMALLSSYGYSAVEKGWY